MINLSYSLNGLTDVNLFRGISEIENASFSGFEFSFQEETFNPYTLTDENILEIKMFLESHVIRPVCISTATTFFLSKVPHEPSVLTLNPLKRQERIDLVKKGIDIAAQLNVPIVSFQSGYIRDEHIKNINIKPKELLLNAVNELISYIGSRDVTLVIEPEPGMLIESLEDGFSLVKEVNSPHFKLHMDIGHVFCTENDYLASIKERIEETAYVHLADIKTGDSVKFNVINSIHQIEWSCLDLLNHSYIFTIEEIFIFINKDKCWYFSNKKPYDQGAITVLEKEFPNKYSCIPYDELPELKNEDECFTEIKAYTDSIPEVDLNKLEQLKPILKFLRIGDSPIIKRTICNTVKGKVHYHERLGHGEIDVKSVLKIIKESAYNGFVTVELYNHVNLSALALPESYEFIQRCISNYSDKELDIISEWGHNVIGDAIDHRIVKPPYIRLISYKKNHKDNYTLIYDLRFVQPGKETISADIMHSMEHLLMKEFKRYLKDKYILLAPMGCQTGFYLVLNDVYQKKEMQVLFNNVLNAVLNEKVVPYQTSVQCGNPEHHNLSGSKDLVCKQLKKYSKIFEIL